MKALRVLIAAAAFFVGAILALGASIAILFEVQGFGTPRDADPRLWYIALYGLGLLVSLVGPFVLVRLLFRRKNQPRDESGGEILPEKEEGAPPR